MRRIGTSISVTLGLVLLFPAVRVLHPAFPLNNVSFEVRTGGNDTNGGGYFANGSQPNMSLYPQKNGSSCTPGVTCYSNVVDQSGIFSGGNTPTIFCATGCNFDANIVNQVVHVAGGSCSITPQWRLVEAQTGATLTLDAAPTTSSGCIGGTLNVGGALQSPGVFCNVLTNNQGGADHGINDAAFYMRNDGIYWITTTTPNVSGGPLVCNANTSPAFDAMIGYNSTRNDWQTTTNNPPIIRVCQNSTPPCTGPVTFNSPTLIINWSTGQSSMTDLNYEVDCNEATNAQGMSDGPYVVWNLTVKNCPAGGFVGNGGYILNGYSYNSTPGMLGGVCLFCVIAGTSNGPSVSSFKSSGSSQVAIGFSVIYGGTGKANYGFSYTASGAASVGLVFNTTIDGAGADCVYNDVPSINFLVVNNILSNCAGKAINNAKTDGGHASFFGYNAEYNNKGGANNYGTWGPGIAINEMTLSSTPYVDAASHNYATAAASGVWCSGFPATFPNGEQSCVDIGAIQHQVLPPSAADGLPRVLPGLQGHPELRKALRLAFEGPHKAQVDLLQRLLVDDRNYDRAGDWIIFIGVSLLLGGLAGVLNRRERRAV